MANFDNSIPGMPPLGGQMPGGQQIPPWLQQFLAQQQGQGGDPTQAGPTNLGAAAQQAAQGGIAAQQAAQGPQPGQVDPNAANAILGLNSQRGEQAKIAQQMKLADAMRASGAAQNRSTSPINTPNWAGALANVAGAYFGRKQDEGAQQRLTDLDEQRKKGYAAALSGLPGMSGLAALFAQGGGGGG